ncbi:hypothetical protein OAO87_03435 [bacterium]|nr:hypothetical protein [bacterium]
MAREVFYRAGELLSAATPRARPGSPPTPDCGSPVPSAMAANMDEPKFPALAAPPQLPPPHAAVAACGATCGNSLLGTEFDYFALSATRLAAAAPHVMEKAVTEAAGDGAAGAAGTTVAAAAIGAGASFAKYFPKFALSVMREKLPEISPSRLM